MSEVTVLPLRNTVVTGVDTIVPYVSVGMLPVEKQISESTATV